MSALGAFTFVLHCHHPFMRQTGRWYHAEEWIHDAIIETYIPLLETLYDLKEEGVPFALTLGISPILSEQLADPLVLEHFEQYLDERLEAAQKDMLYFEKDAYNDHLRYLAEWYRDNFLRIKDVFRNRFGRDLIGAFRRLQDAGLIEILSSAASHAYLPLLSRDSSLNAQIKTGVATYKRLFGRAPSGFWLPGYGYRPAQVTQSGQVRPGIEHFLAASGINSFFVDTHTLTGEKAVGVAAGNVLGTYDVVQRRYTIPITDNFPAQPRSVSPLMPHFVKEVDDEQPSGVTAIARNARMGQQVWGSDLGYPRDFDYRGSHLRAGTSGLQYWRITGANVDPAQRDYYHPDWAAYKIEQHAEHFAHLVGDQLRHFHHTAHEYGLVTASFNANLFGHWWFEGIPWLGKILRHLAHNPDVDLTTPTRFLEQHPATASADLLESSWGIGGEHFLWDNQETHWMWSPIHAAEDRMEQLVEHFNAPSDAEAIVLTQAAREVLLLQSSDWQFLITTGQGRAYAVRRFTEHAERFARLAASLEAGAPSVELAQAYHDEDNLFAEVDYRWFAAHAE
ncbi:MAG: 1,4-alpha-glucan branching protein domain-containing protein [Chloroflexota bacterium]